MKKLAYILSLLLLISSCKQEQSGQDIILGVISNQQSSQPIDLSFLTKEWGSRATIRDFNVEIKAISGEEIVESINFSDESKIEIQTKQAGIARYRLSFSKKNRKPTFLDLTIVSEFLLDFTQNNPFEPGGSVAGIAYPEDSLVLVAREIMCVDSLGNTLALSPGLLVKRKVAAIPHNSLQVFPDFETAIKYYGYKENGNAFNFRYQPLIPMLEVGNGNKNRGVGIIVINKNQLMNDPNIQYEFEAYCSIRTRSDAPETYNLGVVIGTVNKAKSTFKDAVVARDYFNIGYSTSGQIYSKKFSLENDDYLTINIVGEAGLGGDRKRTTRFEYIKISPAME